MTGPGDGPMDMGAGQAEEPNIQSVLRWLNASVIHPGPKDCPLPPISIHIDKIIFADNTANIGQMWKQIMGDHFDKIGAGATIVNRSTLTSSLNRVQGQAGDAAVQALQMVAQIVEDSGDQDAAENFNALSEELDKLHPRKSLLKSFWNGILAALPEIAEITSIADHIAQLFK
jgi:hypothetical protein